MSSCGWHRDVGGGDRGYPSLAADALSVLGLAGSPLAGHCAMAVPSYVLAYCWVDVLEYAGPVQTALRAATGWQRGDYWFPGSAFVVFCIVIMAVVLSPYVFVATRAALLEQGSAPWQSARSWVAGLCGALARRAAFGAAGDRCGGHWSRWKP